MHISMPIKNTKPKLTAEEQTQKTLDKTKAEAHKIIDRECAAFIKKLPTYIKRNLENITASIAGFERRYGDEWTVDHCNGRQSMISQYLKESVEKTLDKNIGQIGKNFKLTVAQKKLLKREFNSTIMRDLSYAVRKQAEETAEKIAKDLVTENFEKILLSTDLSAMANPEYGDTEMEALILDEKAQELARKEE